VLLLSTMFDFPPSPTSWLTWSLVFEHQLVQPPPRRHF
jgi:hypothetical protein